MAHLEIFLLGPLQVKLNRRPIIGPKSTKVGALLAYLAAEASRPHDRNSLAGLLWPDRPNAKARANLRYTLADLRTALGCSQPASLFLHIEQDCLQFNRSSDHWLDLNAFESLSATPGGPTDPAALDRLQWAVELYRGPFLSGLATRSAPFEEWALLKREYFDRKMAAALGRLSVLYQQHGEYTLAEGYARRQLELEPWREEVHRQLMRLLALSGQRSAALAQYETCRRMLDSELGVAPEPATIALYKQIRDEEPGRRVWKRGPSSQAHWGDLALEKSGDLAHEAELAQVDHFLAAALTEQGQPAPTRKPSYSERDGEIGPRLLALFLLANLYRSQARYPESVTAGERLLQLAEQAQEPSYRGLAHWMIGQGSFFRGALVRARAHLEQALSLYDPQATQSLTYLTGADMGVTCLAMLAYDLWGLGYPDLALQHAQRAIALAQTLEQPEPLGLALAVAGSGFHLLRREDALARGRIAELLHLAEERDLAYYWAWGIVHQGWWQVRQGSVEEGIAHIQEGMAAWQAMGMETVRPHHLSVLARAHGRAGRIEEGLQILDQAAQVVEQTGGHYYDLEIHWQRGMLLQAHDPTAAETSLRQAIALAQQQEARSWELRAALSLGRLWKQQRRDQEAHQLVAGSYAWFSEGFGTPDLRDAKALLDGLPEKGA